MRCVLIDDHQILLDSLASSITKNNTRIQTKTYTSCKTFLNEVMFDEYLPDLVITDIVMPEMNGIAFLEICKKQFDGRLNIMVLSSSADVQTIKQAIRAGAKGFLSKLSAIDELLTAIEVVALGKQYIAKNLQSQLLDHSFLEDQVNYRISTREREVLTGICSSKTIKEIAHELGLSVHTVQSYHRNIMKKFKVNRIADLIAFAIKNGFYHI